MQEKIARNDSEISPYGLSTCREIAKKITHVEREREREREFVEMIPAEVRTTP